MAAGCRGLFFPVPPDMGQNQTGLRELLQKVPLPPCTQVASVGANMMSPDCWLPSSSETCLCCYFRMLRGSSATDEWSLPAEAFVPAQKHQQECGLSCHLSPGRGGSASVQVSPSLVLWSPWRRAVSGSTALSPQWPSRTRLPLPQAMEHPLLKGLVDQLHVSKQRSFPSRRLISATLSFSC